jgi:hypothetical protein
VFAYEPFFLFIFITSLFNSVVLILFEKNSVLDYLVDYQEYFINLFFLVVGLHLSMLAVCMGMYSTPLMRFCCVN